jgi:hypothetical protein
MRSNSAFITGLCVALAGCGGGSGTTSVPTASTLSIVLPSNTMVSGTTAQASALVDGAPASGVSWSSENPAILTVTTSGELRATEQGSTVLTATQGSIKGTAIVVVTPGAPILVRIYSGDRQSASTGSNLSEPLCTMVLDAAGNMIKGLVVTYTVATGGGTVGAPSAPATNSQGIAISGLWRLGATSGKQTVTASYGSLAPVTFEATAQ